MRLKDPTYASLVGVRLCCLVGVEWDIVIVGVVVDLEEREPGNETLLKSKKIDDYEDHTKILVFPEDSKRRPAERERKQRKLRCID